MPNSSCSIRALLADRAPSLSRTSQPGTAKNSGRCSTKSSARESAMAQPRKRVSPSAAPMRVAGGVRARVIVPACLMVLSCQCHVNVNATEIIDQEVYVHVHGFRLNVCDCTCAGLFYPRCDLVFHNDPKKTWWSPNYKRM